MTHDEAVNELLRLAERSAAAYNRAGELLAACARQGVRPPDRVRPVDADGEVALWWRHAPALGGGLTLLAGPAGVLCSRGFRVPQAAPDAGAAARWLGEQLGTPGG